MSLIVKDEIGYGIKTGAVFFSNAKPDGGTISRPVDMESFDSAPWSPWGDNNDDPIRMRDDIHHCGALSTGIETNVRQAIGKGLEPHLLLSVQNGEEVLEHLNAPEIYEFLERNEDFSYCYQNVYNLFAYGWGATQMILSRDRTQINRIEATDVFNARLERRQPLTGIIKNLYLCSDWEQVSSYDTNKIKKIPVLREKYELDELEESTTGKEFVVLHRLLKNGLGYYPRAMWRAAQDWVKFSRSVPKFKHSLQENSMNIKYLILIADSYWKRIHKQWDSYDPKKRTEIIQEKYSEINKWLTGEENAGKTVIAGKYLDPFTKNYEADIDIEVLDDKIKDGRFLPDSSASDKQIWFSMLLNPAQWGGNLLGDGASGGAGSGSDIRESAMVKHMMLHVERFLNTKVFNIVKRYNGWSAKYEKPREYMISTNSGTTSYLSKQMITPRLVFRYKAEVPTTLDTGGSKKSTSE